MALLQFVTEKLELEERNDMTLFAKGVEDINDRIEQFLDDCNEY